MRTLTESFSLHPLSQSIKDEKWIYQPIVHISETFAPHLFSSIETYSNCQQRLVNSPPADLGNSSDLITLTSSSWEQLLSVCGRRRYFSLGPFAALPLALCKSWICKGENTHRLVLEICKLGGNWSTRFKSLWLAKMLLNYVPSRGLRCAQFMVDWKVRNKCYIPFAAKIDLWCAWSMAENRTARGWQRNCENIVRERSK